MTKFPAKDIRLMDKCVHCFSRIWYPEDFEPGEKLYNPPKEFKQTFVDTMGKYLLGPYTLRRCEVCGRSMAVFFEPKGVLMGKVFVLYSCSLLMSPKDEEVCKDRVNCYNCPAKGPGPGGL